jgi:beta-galactosidase
MSKRIDLLFFAFLLFGSGFSQTTLFDADWRFYRGGVQGAEMPGFDDSKWRKVDLPHDWSIEDLPTGQAGLPGIHTPFDPNAISQVSGGFTVGGTGWYRKTFTIGTDKKINIHIRHWCLYEFTLAKWRILGTHPYGYTVFGLTN